MSERPDRELLERARLGDRSAIGELFSQYWRAARGAAFGVTGEFASAEDAAAEALQIALAGLDGLRDPNRFGPWLRAIVVRKARLALQRRQSLIHASPDQLEDRDNQPDQLLERLELSSRLRKAICELPDALREAMALVYFEGYDQAAAAQFLDIPCATLRRRLHDGRTRLRAVMEQNQHGSKEMNEERERQIQRLKTMFDSGEIYQALRESLALRPPPQDLIHGALRGRTIPSDGSITATGGMMERLSQSSAQASDPAHPVGSIATAIRQALPAFQDWTFDAGKAWDRFLTGTGDQRGRRQPILPPGFADGKPGAFVRATRAVVRLCGGGNTQSIYEHLQDCADERTFAGARADMRVSDVLDLAWMTSDRLELRSVQELLQRLVSTVLPGTQIKFSAYDEPRYRSGLQLQLGDLSARAACGGVLAQWHGSPSGVEAAHLRIFLDPWAAIQSGQMVAFAVLP